MMGKRKYNLTLIGFLITVLVMLGSLIVYAIAEEPPDEQVLVWFFITVGTLAGSFTFGNAMEHYANGMIRGRQRPTDNKTDEDSVVNNKGSG